MADRAIIPGASQEFLGFLGSAFDSPRVVKENPDAGLVRLQYIYSCLINDALQFVPNSQIFVSTGHTPSSLHDRVHNRHHSLRTLCPQNQMETISLLRSMYLVAWRTRFGECQTIQFILCAVV